MSDRFDDVGLEWYLTHINYKAPEQTIGFDEETWRRIVGELGRERESLRDLETLARAVCAVWVDVDRTFFNEYGLPGEGTIGRLDYDRLEKALRTLADALPKAGK